MKREQEKSEFNFFGWFLLAVGVVWIAIGVIIQTPLRDQEDQLVGQLTINLAIAHGGIQAQPIAVNGAEGGVASGPVIAHPVYGRIKLFIDRSVTTACPT
jgi:hypothetical protein